MNVVVQLLTLLNSTVSVAKRTALHRALGLYIYRHTYEHTHMPAAKTGEGA